MKRLLAALLTLSMLVGIVPFSAFAESPGTVPETFAAAQESPGLDDETVQSIVSDPLLQGQYAPPQQAQPTVDTSNMSMEATDSFGKLLMNSIDEQNSASRSGNRVIGVTVDGSTATVEYVAAEDADVVVAIYTDDSEELMSASGTTAVSATPENTAKSTTTVELTGSIPNSFVVKAFLLDKTEHAPLCDDFTSSAYTKDIQDVANATIDDYPADRVLNLDEQNDTNFAVVKDDVVLVNEDDTSAAAISVADNGNGSYTIYNADKKTRNMQPGEIFVYQCEEGILVVQIETIDVSGSTVVISGNDALDLVDVFDVVKIESTSDVSQMEYNGTGVDDDVHYLGLDNADDALEETNAIDGSLDKSFAMKFVIGTDTFYHGKKEDFEDGGHFTSKFGINAVLNLKMTTEITYYISVRKQSFSYSFENEISGGVEVSYNESATKDKPIKIGLGTVRPISLPGVYINLTPQFVLKAEVKGEFYYKLHDVQGFTLENKNATDTSEEPVSDFSIKVSGSIYVGVEFAPSIQIGLPNLFHPDELYALFEVTLKISGGLRGTMSWTARPVEPNIIVSENHGDSVHECVACLSGDISAEITMSFTVKVIGVWDDTYDLVNLKLKVLTLYYSADFDEFHASIFGHGDGDCPHKLYRVNISVDTAYPPDSAEVFATNSNHETYSIGNLIGSTNNYCYMEPGDYTLKTTIQDNDFTCKFTVSSIATDVTLQYDTGTATSGICGDNLTWDLDQDGTLVIRGTGAMTDYDPDNNRSPWSSRYDIKKVIIQDGVTTIGAWAFNSCWYLTSIEIPNSVTRIGSHCIRFCGRLLDLVIPDSVTQIDSYAFDFNYLEKITLPPNITCIEDFTFNGSSNLTSITVPDGVTRIGSWAFAQCPNLVTVEIPDSVESIDTFAFALSTSLNRISLPDGLTSIENGLFSGCSALTSVDIPDSVTTIGDQTFDECYSLLHVTIPNSVTNIGTIAFKGSGLVDITLPSNLDSIASETFAACANLTSITIPTSVTYIGYDAFSYCTNLKTVNYTGSPEQWNTIGITSGNSALKNASINFYYTDASALSFDENSISDTMVEGGTESGIAAFSSSDDQVFTSTSPFTGLVPGTDYSIIVSCSLTDPLNPKSLVYINQITAPSSGEYSLTFRLKGSSTVTASDMVYVVAAGGHAFSDNTGGGSSSGGNTSSGGSSSGGGGGGGGAAVLIGVGAAAAITAGVIMMSPVEIKGRVVLADQTAVSGAKISLLREGKVVAQTTADENGSFSLKAKRGSYGLTAAYTNADGQLIYKTIDIKAPAKDLTVTF